MAEQVGFASDKDIDKPTSLPDEVIVRIISYLDRHEAVRTTLLSRKWRSLFTWTAFLTLDCSPISYAPLRDRRIFYPPLHGFQELEIPLGRHFQLNHLNSASFLFNCNTLVRLKLRFSQYFTLVVPDTVHLPKLKVLHLEQIKFSDNESVQRLFSGCCVLEELVVKCWKWEHIRQFSVSSPTLKAVILRSLICSYPNQELVINAPNLVCFEHLDFGPTVHLRGIGNIESHRYLGNRVMRAFGLYRGDEFPNLTYPWNDILARSPCLETLVIDLVLCPGPGHRLILPYRLSLYKLSKLKAIEFLSFRGKQHEMQLVKHLLNNAPFLQYLTLHVHTKERLPPEVTQALSRLARVSKKCNISVVSNILNLF
ncbi:hypothetical protein PTKIN_Ptkin14bG0055600 [Pterospermum kingtungense]